jgi:hypothetical protein
MWYNFLEGALIAIGAIIFVCIFTILWFVPIALALILMNANWLWWYVITIPIGAGLANVLNNM